MKMAQYGPDIIRFMCDASDYSTYHKELAAKISAHLSADDSVCDAGCGLGHLSLALSPYCGQISAVDISHEALAVLKKNIHRAGCQNIRVTQGDIESCVPEEPYDVMVFCFFGRMDETLRLAKAQCRGKVILIKRNWNTSRFSISPTPLKRQTFEQTCDELKSRRINFTCETFALEMGQPFRTLGDAATFFGIYGSDDGAECFSEQDVKSRLVKLTSEEYPYYYPSLKKMGMIVIDTGDIPDNKKYL